MGGGEGGVAVPLGPGAMDPAPRAMSADRGMGAGVSVTSGPLGGLTDQPTTAISSHDSPAGATTAGSPPKRRQRGCDAPPTTAASGSSPRCRSGWYQHVDLNGAGGAPVRPQQCALHVPPARAQRLVAGGFRLGGQAQPAVCRRVVDGILERLDD